MRRVVMAVMLATAVGGTWYAITRLDRQARIDKWTSEAPAVFQAGLGVHLECAVLGAAASAKDLASASEELGAGFAGLPYLARERFPADFEVRFAHRCRRGGRRFVHVGLFQGSRSASLILTHRDADHPGFAGGALVPAFLTRDIPVYRAQAGGCQMAGFDSGEYLVYVIADLPESETLGIAQQLAPAIQAHTRRLAREGD